MKSGTRRYLAGAACCAVLILWGCSKSDPVKEYGQALLNARTRSQAVAGEANLEALQTTINAFEISNGRYPASLDEIKDGFSGRIDWNAFDYDPRTGKVRRAQ